MSLCENQLTRIVETGFVSQMKQVSSLKNTVDFVGNHPYLLGLGRQIHVSRTFIISYISVNFLLMLFYHCIY